MRPFLLLATLAVTVTACSTSRDAVAPPARPAPPAMPAEAMTDEPMAAPMMADPMIGRDPQR